MNTILTGADQPESYLPILEGKRIAIVANQTSEIDGKHLVDSLLVLGKDRFELKRVFAPEHGFRGNIDDGVEVLDETDVKSGLPVFSLYGRNKKPIEESLEGIDLVIFDIQDVGVRFYTFISTMHYVMEACAENDIPLLVLDRPNPNGSYADGPILKEGFESFVGIHPIPVVHGLTIGELAKMINGEAWLANGVSCELRVIPCMNYTHQTPYSLPVKPSPNLPNDHSIKIYPSTCFFEGTVISEGRGTLNPFEVYGHPELKGSFSFVPKSIEGMEMNPKFKGITCYGEDLRDFEPSGGWTQLELRWLIDAYNKFPDKEHFFTAYFDKLAGTDELRKQLIQGKSEKQIRESWQEDLQEYMILRKKYLLYKE